MNVLIVDDNPTDRKMLKIILEHHGCAVIEARDGEEGLDRAVRDVPDVIVSDALMPKRDGYQLLKAVKADERLKNVPFVFYTAVYTGPREADLAASLGADAFLSKPLDAVELWNRIRAAAERRREPGARAEHVPPVAGSEFLERYSAIVASKLEEKVGDLEREIAERRAAEETITKQHQELRALSAKLAEAEEQERRRIARELHDQVGQNLSALGISLNIVQSRLPPEGMEAARSRIEDSISLLQQTTDMVRTVMADLRPPLLDEYGLAAAVEWYGRRFADRTGIAVEVLAAGPAVRLGAGKEGALLRIAQEALTNAAKHAKATRITVHLGMAGPVFSMVIEDNGAGFDPAALPAKVGRAGWGLLNMAERARMAGGECRVESAPGRGAVVAVEVAP